MAENPQKQSDRQKVLEWLASIGETDPVIIAEVIESCSNDIESRRYFVGRHQKIVKNDNPQNI